MFEKGNIIILSKITSNKSLMIPVLSKEFSSFNWIFINNKEEFTYENLKKINPIKIFIPHWSYIIPKKIVDEFECIVFHMTDLPYGRGGSPLQNLIVRGHKTTKLSAIRINEGVDTGDVYLKKELKLNGKASEIFQRSRKIVVEMISEIIKNNIKPIKQFGEVTEFKRRSPEMSNLKDLKNLEEIFDYIRMLDAEGYPNAFVETEFVRFEFTNANFNNEKELSANVRIIKK